MKLNRSAHVVSLLSACCGALIVVLLSAWLLAGLPRRTATYQPGERSSFLRYLQEKIPVLQERYGVPGVAVLLLRDGEASWSGTFGYACRESREPLTADHVLMTHSISKAVTARGIVQLAREGAIDLDRPVSDYLGPVPYGSAVIRRLLSNSAGLPLGPIGLHYKPGDPLPDTAELFTGIAWSAEEPRVAVPERFEYSNLGFALLELVVREVTGTPFAEYMREAVLDPLGMKDSTFAWTDDLRGRVPLGYDLAGTPVAPYLYPNQAPGGLFSTLEDMGRFLAASMNDPIDELYVPHAAITGIYAAVADRYGLGHFLETLPGGEPAAFHGGQGLGWMTHFHILPERGEGIVIITNSQRSWPLIASLLRDWSIWTGAGAVGMSRILSGTYALALVIVLLGAAGLGVGARGVLRGVRGARRASGLITVAELLGAGVIAALLAWALRQDYLFLHSVFPTLARPLGASLALLAAGLVADGGLSIMMHRRPTLAGLTSAAQQDDNG